MDRLTGMAVFAKVAEAKSFTAAAQSLGLSKSAVSKQVARLEDRLGARLINRTTRRLSLTAAGDAFYERCARVLAEAEEAELAVTRLQAEPRGVLKVNAPMSFGVLHLASAIPDFLGRYPELQVDLTLNDRFVDLVEEGFDVAVRIAQLTDSALIARRLAPSRRVVCASPEYLAKNGAPETPQDLLGHNCLLYAYTAPGDEWRYRDGRSERSLKVAGNLKANNGEVLRAAAVAGYGITILPTFMVGDDLRAGRLRRVLPQLDDDTASVYAVYPHARHLATKVRVFVDFLAARFGARPYWDEGLS